MGFVIGLFDFGRIAGIACLGVVGGLALGMRIVIFKDALLVPQYFVNWLIVVAFGLCGLLLVLWSQRIGIVSFYFLALPGLYEPFGYMTDIMHLFGRHFFHRLRRRSWSQ